MYKQTIQFNFHWFNKFICLWYFLHICTQRKTCLARTIGGLGNTLVQGHELHFTSVLVCHIQIQSASLFNVFISCLGMKNIGKPCTGIWMGRGFVKHKLAKLRAQFDESLYATLPIYFWTLRIIQTDLTKFRLSRHSLGVMPNFIRKAREKCDELLNPF